MLQFVAVLQLPPDAGACCHTSYPRQMHMRHYNQYMRVLLAVR